MGMSRYLEFSITAVELSKILSVPFQIECSFCIKGSAIKVINATLLSNNLHFKIRKVNTHYVRRFLVS